MDYFCYISRIKVDQLFQTLADRSVDEWTEKQTTENGLSLDAKADVNLAWIVNLFKSGVTYGRKGVIQREQKVKLHYAEKLRRVLMAIAAQQPIPQLSSVLQLSMLPGTYFHAAAAFRPTESLQGQVASTRVVTLGAEVAGRTLLLDCSLGHFSEGNQPDGGFAVNSSNARFFCEAMPLHLETVFVLLSQNEHEIIGTPLFLKLSAASSVVL